ncbi:MAG: hypothetical protein U1D30_24650 [Planctomycetota bacterium]
MIGAIMETDTYDRELINVKELMHFTDAIIVNDNRLPDDVLARCYGLRSLAKAYNNDRQGAAKDLIHAMKYSGEHKELRLRLARVTSAHDQAAAKQMIDRLLIENPQDPETVATAALLDCFRGDVPAARRQLASLSVQRCPGYLPYYANGICDISDRAFQNAATNVIEIILKHPDHFNESIAKLYFDAQFGQGRYRESLDACQLRLDMEPSRGVLIELWINFEHISMPFSCMRLARSFHSFGPKDPWAKGLLVLSRIAIRDFDGAKEEVSSVISENRPAPEAKWIIASVFGAAGDFRKSLEYLDESVRLRQGDINANVRRAWLLLCSSDQRMRNAAAAKESILNVKGASYLDAVAAIGLLRALALFEEGDMASCQQTLAEIREQIPKGSQLSMLVDKAVEAVSDNHVSEQEREHVFSSPILFRWSCFYR